MIDGVGQRARRRAHPVHPTHPVRRSTAPRPCPAAGRPPIAHPAELSRLSRLSRPAPVRPTPPTRPLPSALLHPTRLDPRR
ncbi:hypothetical protein [Micromonospora tulbaghiae]|uniref:hypothetical protein n=1 Tax=Micromonospora tulbaghiae TaxID=479978 RepID=UPI0013C4F98B|nr:hypothetical protein [Micromonospora tulbaghiae]